MLVRGAIDKHVRLLSEEKGLCDKIVARCSGCMLRKYTYVAGEFRLDKAIPRVAQLSISS